MTKSDNRVCFIFNAAARRGRAGKRLEWLKNEAAERWNDFDIITTGENGHADDLTPDKFREYDAVIACGGDGTLHNAVNQALHGKIVMGLLPMGSGNDFAKAIGMPRDKNKCLDILARGNTRKVDLIKCTGDAEKWCINTVGAGLDGLANCYTNNYKKYVGTAGYFLGALSAVFSFRGAKMKITTDEGTLNDHFLMLTSCNGQIEGGSFIVAPEAEIDDGYIDLLIIRKTSIPKLLYYLPKFKKRLPREMNGLSILRSKKIVIESEEPLSVHGDGEHLGSEIKHLELQVYPKSVEMIVPD